MKISKPSDSRDTILQSAAVDYRIAIRNTPITKMRFHFSTVLLSTLQHLKELIRGQPDNFKRDGGTLNEVTIYGGHV